MPTPPPRQDPAPHEYKTYSVPEKEPPAALWRRMPPRARRAATAAAALVVALALILTVRYFILGGPSLQRVSGEFQREGADYSLDFPGKSWFTPRRPQPGLEELEVFYRGRGPGAPVVLRIYRRKIPTPMPPALSEESALLLKPFFVKRGERLLVAHGLGFETGDPEPLDNSYGRVQVLLAGKAVPPDAAAYPVRMFFAYSGHDEYALVFRISGDDPAQYEKEIVSIAESFRVR